MIVYRIEDKYGIGPYIAGDADAVGLAVDNAPDHQPGPLDDIPGWRTRPTGRWQYGFKSLRSLRQWFDGPILSQLIARGFRIAVIDAPDVLIGGHQVAFNRRTATTIETGLDVAI